MGLPRQTAANVDLPGDGTARCNAIIRPELGRAMSLVLACAVTAVCITACLLASSALAQQARPDTASGMPGQAAALASVGRLLVPAVRYKNGYPSHFFENCSATLVAHAAGAAYSRIVVSAWHCIEDYRDLSRSLIFENVAGTQTVARVIKSGGGMHSDWVLLRLDEALPGPAVLNPASRPPGAAYLTAGYPRPAQGLQTVLQVHNACQAIGAPAPDITIDCVLTKGASGGGVFNSDEAVSYAGVISRGDSATLSIFVPVARFIQSLAQIEAPANRAYYAQVGAQ